LQLAPDHDVDLYAQIFAQFGRLHIPQLLREEDALRIHEALAKRTPWRLTVIHNDVFYDLSPEQQAEMSDEQKSAFEDEVYDFAARQYEGRYRTLRLSELGEPFAGDIPELTELTAFLNSEPFLDFISRVTGSNAIDFADAQATCYVKGDFLHPHFDTDEVKKRIAAYVLNLTPRWKVEWGGLLTYVGPDGHVTEAYTPAWNALNLLRVEELHFVSCVAPFAPAERYSVTGWLRGR
jgi:Rps23 Pro-64 3,4-dihydroxylase Tpa1-like proline 4-hydroxylase